MSFSVVKYCFFSRKRSIDEAERLRFLASVKENVAHRDEQMRMLLGNQKEVQRLCNLIMVERKVIDCFDLANLLGY